MRFYQLKGTAPGERPAAPRPAAMPLPGGMAAPARAFVPGIGGYPSTPETEAPAMPDTVAAVADTTPRAPQSAGHQYPPSTAQQILGSKERQALGALCARAWKVALAADPGIIDAYPTATAAQTDWRHCQISLATREHPAGRVRGISDATRAHYKDIEAHFLMLCGDSPRDFHAAMETGFTKTGDLRADSKQAWHALKELNAEMEKTGLHPNYLLAIAANKFPGVKELNRKQLWQLVYTIRNRANAKAGKGDAANRNKSQRRKANPSQPF